MNLKEYLDNAVNAARRDTLAKSDQLTLGELILKIEPIVKDVNKSDIDEPLVWFDFGDLFPTTIDSWRGIYAELALNFTKINEATPLTVTKFYQLLKSSIGKSFTGYKGGEFVMSKHTPIWVSNHGKASNTAVIDVVFEDYMVIIITGYRKS